MRIGSDGSRSKRAQPRRSTIWGMSMTGDPPPFRIVATPFDENYARLSPDGRWMAYASNESGRYEVYVTSFPDGNGKW